jgi:hypothetical protein
LAIDFTGHCGLDIAGAQRLIEHLRSLKPAGPLGRFGLEIAREFWMEARSRFLMSVIDKERLDEVRDAVEMVYKTFGTRRLVVTWGMIRSARRSAIMKA